ncbi:MAG: histidine triad nucleotide-binding protein [Candidatus Melainabacteria bacterium]
MSDCLFCKIVAGDIPAERVFENDHVLAFPDINPQAPTHWLVIPKTHVAGVAAVDDPGLFQHVMAGARQAAVTAGLSDYRLVINNGAGAGQTVFHWHVHLLGGRSFSWPPG